MSLAAVRERMAKQREEVAPSMCCTFCNRSTTFEALATLGARCPACFESYCRMAPKAPHVPAAATAGAAPGTEWAYRLKWRHEQGERLTKAQIETYREVTNRAEAA